MSEVEVVSASVDSNSIASTAKKEKKAMAPKPDKVAKPKGDKKAEAPANNPKYTEMITKSIAGLKERGGSSRQNIVKYILFLYLLFSLLGGRKGDKGKRDKGNRIFLENVKIGASLSYKSRPALSL